MPVAPLVVDHKAASMNDLVDPNRLRHPREHLDAVLVDQMRLVARVERQEEHALLGDREALEDSAEDLPVAVGTPLLGLVAVVTVNDHVGEILAV